MPLPQRSAGPLCNAVAALCSQLQPQVSAGTAAGLRRVRARLAEPLQVAVAGRLKAGKSTLVNALIGRRVAPTGVGECTRLVTRFRYGDVDRVELVFVDGSTRALPFDADGMIPADLGVELSRVSHLDAYLTSDVLADLTVIDTPGLASADTASVARTRQLLARQPPEHGDATVDAASTRAVADAEAVLYVFTQGVRADDSEALAAFTAATAGRDTGPVHALGVLNKIDTVAPETVAGSGGQLWPAARALATAQAELLRLRVAGVLPVIGLLAETAGTGGFTRQDANALRQLAALDDESWQLMTVAADLFTSWECAVPEGVRRRLLAKLDLHGAAVAVAALRADPDTTVGALRATLWQASGMSELRAQLDTVFRARADGIKAAAALAAVGALARGCGDPAERQRVHDAVEALQSRPEVHRLRLLRALAQLTSEAVGLPGDLAAEAFRLGGDGDAASLLGLPGRPSVELADRALQRAGWWRSFAVSGISTAQSRIAHEVHRAYFLLWQQLRASADLRQPDGAGD